MSRSNRIKRRAIASVVAAFAVMLNHHRASAETATWNGTTDSNWTTNTDWSTEVTPGSTTNSANVDTAVFNNAANGRTSVNLPSQEYIQNILFDTASAPSYTITGNLIGTSGGEVEMTPTVTNSQNIDSSGFFQFASVGLSYEFANSSPNSAAVMNLGALVLPQPTASSPAALQLYLGGSNSGSNTISGNIQDVEVNLGTFSHPNDATETVDLFKTDPGTWILSGNDTYTGQTTVAGGALEIAGKAETNSLTIEDGAVFTINNTTTLQNNRLGTQVTMEGATLNYISGNGTNSETNIQALYVYGGANTIDLTPNPAGPTSMSGLYLVRYQQSGGAPMATLMIVGTNLGAPAGANNTTLSASPGAYTQAPIGAGGAGGSTNMNISNFMVGRDLSQSGNAQYGFVAWNGSTLRTLNLATEYATSISDSQDNGSEPRNVSLTSTATVGAAGTTVNSLRLDTAGAVSGTGTLNVYSGSILALPGNAGIGVQNLNFESPETIITTIGNLSLNSNVTMLGLDLTKTGPGTLALSAGTTLNYSGETTINQGVIELGANNQLPTGSPLLLSGGTLDLNGFNQAVAGFQTGYAPSTSLAGSAVVGNIINSNSSTTGTFSITSNLDPGGSQCVIGAPGANNLSFAIVSPAALTLAHQNDYAGSTILADGGSINLDFSEPYSPSSDILPTTTHLTMDSGSVGYDLGAMNTSQAINGVSLSGGSNSMVFGQDFNAPFGTMQVNLGAITRTVGATLDLDPETGSGGFITSDTNTNGIIGGWLTLNGADWAVANGSGDVTFPTYVNDTWSAGSNVTVTKNSTQTNAVANSLRFGAVGTSTVTLAGICTLSSGGILVADVGGTISAKITGGTLEGAPGGDLIVNNYAVGSNSSLEIDSTIADNGSATALTVSGVMPTILGGANTYTGPTYLNGEVTVSSNANLGSPSAGAPIYLEGGNLQVSGSMTLDNGGANARPIIVVGSSALTVSQGQTLTIDGVVSGSSSATLTQGSTFGIGTVSFTAANTFSGTYSIYQGALLLGNSNAAQDMTINIGQSSGNGLLQFQPGISQFNVGGLSGRINGSLNLEDTTGNPITLSVGGTNLDSIFDSIYGSGNLVKVGTGTLTLGSETNINGNLTGSITISGGVLQLGLSSTWDGPVNQFGGSGSIGPANIADNARLVFDLPTSGNQTTSTESGSISGNGSVFQLSKSDTLILSGNNTYSGGTSILAGTITIAAAGALPSGRNVLNDGTLNVNANSTIGQVTGFGTVAVGSSTQLRFAANSGLSQQSAISIASGSSIDLANNQLIINYGSGADPIASVAAWLASGYNGGAWNGPGIMSTTAQTNPNYGIGYADSADPGNPANLSSGQIEIMYTLLGDANLDGKVNGIDFDLLATNFNQAVTDGWDKGDFNYDGKVNGIDFNLLAENFNQAASQSAVSAADWAALDSFALANGISLTDVPEPASAGMMVVAGFGILFRRRRSYALRRTVN